MNAQLKYLPIECLQRGQYQPRQHFDEDALQELADSIKSQGLIEPLVVRALGANAYEIVAGERRWRASQRVGLATLPCIIGDYSDEQAAAVTLIENIQRQDLNLIEEAQGYQRLLEEFHYQQQEVAVLVGKSRSHIANVIRVLTLIIPVQEALKKGELMLGHARMLVGLPTAQQAGLLNQIINNQWSVRQLEAAVRELKNTPQLMPQHTQSRDVLRLQQIISEQMGAPVQIVNDEGQGGWLKVKFFDNDTLAGLLERMGLRYD